MVGELVEHGRGHLGVAEDLRPVGDGEVGGEDDRGVFAKLADQVEQLLVAGLAEGQIAQLVDNDQVVPQPGLDEPTALAGDLFLFELVDEIDEVEEAATGARHIALLTPTVREDGAGVCCREQEINRSYGQAECQPLRRSFRRSALAASVVSRRCRTQDRS